MGQGLLERDEGGIQGPLQRGMLELLLAEPDPMPLRPVLAAEEATAVTVQELDHPMPPAENVAPDGLAAAQEIADRLSLIGHANGG